jgi:predicted nucleic acid-binding protein
MLLSAIAGGLELIELSEAAVLEALQISNFGHAKSGYPTFYDSAYHALALLRGGVFLTSDHRYAAKAASFGSVVLLKEWRSHFQTAHPS